MEEGGGLPAACSVGGTGPLVPGLLLSTTHVLLFHQSWSKGPGPQETPR